MVQNNLNEEDFSRLEGLALLRDAETVNSLILLSLDTDSAEVSSDLLFSASFLVAQYIGKAQALLKISKP